jgi:hypothetical protein
MKNGPFIDDLAIKRMIFHSYVSLPEGNHQYHQFPPKIAILKQLMGDFHAIHYQWPFSIAFCQRLPWPVAWPAWQMHLEGGDLAQPAEAPGKSSNSFVREWIGTRMMMI